MATYLVLGQESYCEGVPLSFACWTVVEIYSASTVTTYYGMSP